MEIRIVGAHQGEAIDRRFTTLLVDGGVAIDAGSLAGGLTLDEQRQVGDVLITHQHWDHVKDLASFGFNLLGAGQTANVYCTDEVRQIVSEHLLTSSYWIDFFAGPNPLHPVYQQRRVDLVDEFLVGPYRVRAIPVNHTVPTVGYQVTDAAGRKVYYTGDNGPGCGRLWAMAEPHLLITECTYSNVQQELAARSGHLSPRLLEEALLEFGGRRGYLPRVILVHVNPFHEARIRIEIEEVARRLSASIELGREGQTVVV